jgi:hypothetical protein
LVVDRADRYDAWIAVVLTVVAGIVRARACVSLSRHAAREMDDLF